MTLRANTRVRAALLRPVQELYMIISGVFKNAGNNHFTALSNIHSILVKQKMLNPNIQNTVIVMPWNNIVLYNYNFFERITDTFKRIYFLLPLIFVANRKFLPLTS